MLADYSYRRRKLARLATASYGASIFGQIVNICRTEQGLRMAVLFGSMAWGCRPHLGRGSSGRSLG